MNGGNPYGAVPEALKETRLTLRDLMADHLANKVAEGRLSLAKTQAETETAMVGANLKKEEMVNLRDIAHLTQQANQFGERQAQEAGQFATTTGLQERGLTQAATAETNRNANDLSRIALDEKRVGIDTARAAREAEDAARQKEVVSVRQHLKEKHLVSDDLLDKHKVPDTKMRRDEIELWEKTTGQDLINNPGLKLTLEMDIAEDKVRQIHKDLAQPGLDPATAKLFREEADRLMQGMKTTQTLIMNRTQPKPEVLAEHAVRAYATGVRENSIDPTKITEAQYVDKYVAYVDQARTKFHTNMNELDIKGKKLKVDPKYDQTETTASATIKAKATPAQAASIAAGYSQLTAKGDFSGALDYLTGHARQLSSGGKTAATGKPASPDSSLSLMTGRATPGSPLAEAHAAEAALEAKATETFQNIGKRVSANATVEGKRSTRAAAEAVETERLKKLGKTPDEINALLGTWRLNHP